MSSPSRSCWGTPVFPRRRFTPRRLGKVAIQDRFGAQAAREAAGRVLEQVGSFRPEAGIILGSGLGALAERVEQAGALAYEDIPGFPCSSVAGHANQLILGRLSRRDVAVMSGRVHLYEGFPAGHVAFPIRVLHALGIKWLVVSNAAGGLNPDFRAGDLMLIRDHIFLPGLAGHNPLFGPNDDALGPRFPSMVDAYDPGLRAIAREVALRLDQPIREGVYVMAAGPSYETPAECLALRLLGADAVGMSTCPEVVAARHLGLTVLGVSLITNILGGQPGPSVSHEEVLAAGRAAAGRFAGLVEALVGTVRLG